jgi:aldehyde:ferredoxin oxidoreductase
MARSFWDRILRVDLTSGEWWVEERGTAYWRRYMGGWNVILDTLLREVPADADPLGPENRLVFAPGVLTGLPLSGASRNAIGAKSPLTGGLGATEVGGFWGAELKQAGYDALIVQGAAPGPVYLWIDGADGERPRIEIRDARSLWGKTTKETLAAVQEELGDPRVRCAMIGPGGENLVAYACVMNGLKDAGGRTGMGAVMGAKKLKAIAVRGTKTVQSANPGVIRDMAREMAAGVRAGEKALGLHQYGTGRGLEGSLISGNLPVNNFRDGEYGGAEALSADVYMGQIGVGMTGCYACAVRCKKMVRAEAPYELDPDYGGPEYESAGALGSCCGVEDIIPVAKATELCNAYSLDTIGAGVAISFAMECFENELISVEDTGGIELRFGNGDAVVQMVEMIARREGIGDLLAKDLATVAREIGGGSEAYAMEVKGQAWPMHEPRFKRGLSFGYATSPTGADHCHSLHDVSLQNVREDGLVDNAVLRAYGVLEPLPLEDLSPAKVRAAMLQTFSRAMGNCLPVCLFVPWSTDELRELVRAATGFDVSDYELLKVGERALTLARVFNLRHGLSAKDDYLPQRTYEPKTSGALAEGGIDRDALQAAIHTHYALMGWHRETGVPLPDTLHGLDVSWAIQALDSVKPLDGVEGLG